MAQLEKTSDFPRCYTSKDNVFTFTISIIQRFLSKMWLCKNDLLAPQRNEVIQLQKASLVWPFALQVLKNMEQDV